MPKLIRDGAIVEDEWRAADEESPLRDSGRVATLDQWLALENKAASAVQLEPGQAPAPLLEHLDELVLVVVNFPAFADGRGFSYGRELRERGFKGELRASGVFLEDQLTYLRRCGFNAFSMTDESQLATALGRLADFSEAYQASADEPLPLFRRRT